MTRTTWLLLAVLLLGGLAWWATASDGNRRAATNDREFAYTESDHIHRIFVADRLGNTAELTRGGRTGWTYNGEYPANENVMKNLLQAVTQVEVQSLPASKAVPNMVRNLAAGGILVQLFDREGNKLRGYYVGGGTKGELGTVAIMENSDNPYVVHLPMWTGNLRHRFNLRGDEWRSKRLFTADPDRVEHLSIEYPTQRDQSFRLERGAGGDYTLRPFFETGRAVRRVPRGVAEGVLSRYENYYVSRYENRDTASIGAARRRLPFAVIRLKEEGREEQTVTVYARFRDQLYTQDTESGQTIDLGGLSAYTAFINNDRDWALLAVETTQPLLVSYASF